MVAMTKENSPICVRLIPACTAVRTGWPERNDPTVTPTDLPTSTTTASESTRGQSRSAPTGSNSMPIETKKIPVNMSRSGSMSGST
jgi:hypothetical protein